MNEAAAHITLTPELYDDTPDFRPTSAFTDTIAPRNRPTLSMQPQVHGKTADAAIGHGEEERKGGKNKKKPRPRYDRIWKWTRCDKKEMEFTRAKNHVLKKHVGLSFKDAMVERPKKLRKSSAV